MVTPDPPQQLTAVVGVDDALLRLDPRHPGDDHPGDRGGLRRRRIPPIRSSWPIPVTRSAKGRPACCRSPRFPTARSVSGPVPSAQPGRVAGVRPRRPTAEPVGRCRPQTGLTVAGSTLEFMPIEHEEQVQYELIVDNKPSGRYVGAVNLDDLDLGVGEHQLALQSVTESGSLSSPSESVSYTKNAPPDASQGNQMTSPWVMMNVKQERHEDAFVRSWVSAVAGLGGAYKDRALLVQQVQLAERTAGGEPFLLRVGDAPPLDISGWWVVADIGGGLTNEQVVEYCDHLLPQLSPGMFCIAFDGQGNQLGGGG